MNTHGYPPILGLPEEGEALVYLPGRRELVRAYTTFQQAHGGAVSKWVWPSAIYLWHPRVGAYVYLCDFTPEGVLRGRARPGPIWEHLVKSIPTRKDTR